MKYILRILILILLPALGLAQNIVWLAGSTIDNSVVARGNFFVKGTGNLGGMVDTTGSVAFLPPGATRIRPQDTTYWVYNGRTTGRKWFQIGTTFTSPVLSVNGMGGNVVLFIPTLTSQLTNDALFITAAQAPVQSVNGQFGAVVIDGSITHIGGDGTFITVTGLGTAGSPYAVHFIGGLGAGNNADSIRHRFVDTTGLRNGSLIQYNTGSNTWTTPLMGYGMVLNAGLWKVDTTLIQTKVTGGTIALASNKIFMGNGSNVATPVFVSLDDSTTNTGSFYNVGIRGSPIPPLTPGYLHWTGATWAFNNIVPLSANQTITWTASGDIIGTASGATSLTPALTLASVISAGSCTNCNLTYDAKGRLLIAANGSAGTGSVNTNVGAKYRLAVANTNQIKTIGSNFGLIIDSTLFANALNFVIDSSVVATNSYVLRQGFGFGGFNSNVGTGFRIAIPNTNQLKTFLGGYGILGDSSVANTVRFSIDTAHLVKDTITAINVGTPGVGVNQIYVRSSGHQDSLFVGKLVQGGGIIITKLPDSSTQIAAGVTGNTNTNLGAGFRWAFPGTNNLRTFFNGFGTLLDSATNANGLTIKFDSTAGGGFHTQPYLDGRYIRSVANGQGTTWNGTGVDWGGYFSQNILLQDTTTIGNHTISITGVGSVLNPLFHITNNGSSVPVGLQVDVASGEAIVGNASTTGIGVTGTSGSGVATTGFSVSGVGVSGSSNSGVGGLFSVRPSSTSGATIVLRLNSQTSGTPINGLGGSIQYETQFIGGGYAVTNQLTSIWTDATAKTSEFGIWGTLAGVGPYELLSANGNGYITFNQYPSLSPSTDTTNNKPLGINLATGVISRMTNWVGGGGGGGGAAWVPATAPNTANYTVTTSNYITLSDLTGQANRNAVLPTSPTSGQTLYLRNINTNASGFNWTATNGTIKDFSNNTVTVLSNNTGYWLVFDGTNWDISN